MKHVSKSEKLLVREALEDLDARTLSMFSGKIARLIYLASLRDYNTGHYYHDGLADQFGEEVASEALMRCHQETFAELSSSSIQEMMRALSDHVQSLQGDPENVYVAWIKLGAYKVIVPMDFDPLAQELYSSNLRCALAILQHSSARSSGDLPNA